MYFPGLLKLLIKYGIFFFENLFNKVNISYILGSLHINYLVIMAYSLKSEIK